MQEKLVYEYASIRYVPCVERGEFLNIGVIVFCKRKKYLNMQYQLDENRLKSFSGEIDLEELEAYLRSWTFICQGQPEGGAIAQLDPAYRFRWITAPKSTILQCSPVHPGICEEPGEVLQGLFRKYVL